MAQTYRASGRGPTRKRLRSHRLVAPVSSPVAAVASPDMPTVPIVAGQPLMAVLVVSCDNIRIAGLSVTRPTCRT